MSSSPKRPSKPSESESSHQARNPSDSAAQPSSEAFAEEQASSSLNAPNTVETSSDQPSEMTSELASTANATGLTPPNRPKPPAAQSPADTPPPQDGGDEFSQQASVAMRQQPIPPPSEPMQYRAIGLIRGRYAASEEQFTRGILTTSDGTEIDAVLLGRIMSLVRKHLDLAQEHLWVVYPRTRPKEGTLHAQIVGVWEPEKLGRTDQESATTAESESAAQAEASLDAGVEDGYFSVRGEVVYQSPEDGNIVVKIQQSARKEGSPEKAFKVQLDGSLTGKAVGYFWDLQARLQGDKLVIRDAHSIGILPPRKRPAGERRRGGPPRRGRMPQRPPQGGDRSGSAMPTPAPRKAPLPKPVKRKDTPGEGQASE